jgi:hypothetical protein
MSNLPRPPPPVRLTGLSDPRSTGHGGKPRVIDIHALRGTKLSGQ